jgi:exodeoxyribonuclease VII small subunit
MTTVKTDRKIARPEEKIGFEKAMERLDKIVGEMESGSLTLEEMISRFEEGQSLIKFCGEKLNEVEKKVEMLVKKGDEITTEAFGGEDAEESEDVSPSSESGNRKRQDESEEKDLF